MNGNNVSEALREWCEAECINRPCWDEFEEAMAMVVEEWPDRIQAELDKHVCSGCGCTESQKVCHMLLGGVSCCPDCSTGIPERFKEVQAELDAKDKRIARFTAAAIAGHKELLEVKDKLYTAKKLLCAYDHSDSEQMIFERDKRITELEQRLTDTVSMRQLPTTEAADA
jgi:hypothetical protein